MNCNKLLQTVFILLVVTLLSCTDSSLSTPPPEYKPYIEMGDFSEISQQKYLRVLTPLFADQARYLPRKGLPIDTERKLIEAYAAASGLTLVWVKVNDFSELIPKLLAGEGDLISANLTATELRKKSIAFTLPLDVVSEKLIMPTNKSVTKLEELQGKSIAIQASSSFWQTAQSIVAENNKINIKQIPEGVSVQTILDSVFNGEYDSTIVDSNLFDAVTDYTDGLTAALTVAEDKVIAWGLRPNSTELKASLDKYIQNQKITAGRQIISTDDLAEIKKRKVLRVLTRNNAATYYLWRGELVGFEYELVKEFAKQQDLTLEMIVVPTRNDLEEWLIEGKGDLVAASMTIRETKDSGKITFSNRYNIVKEVLVARSDDPIEEIADLADRKIVVRKSSSYWQSLSQLKKAGTSFELIAAPESMETEDIISKVADGTYDLTMADEHITEIELAWRRDIKVAFTLGDSAEHGWIVRKQNTKLLEAVNSFIEKNYRGLFYNVTKQKYFKRKRQIAKQLKQRVDGETKASLSPYDELVKPAAKHHNIDWRLVIAQMYQESRFDPNAKSWVGALGLMQVMPRTAKELGIDNLSKPSNGIQAGVKYLAWLNKRFDSSLSITDKMWFVLASYNAGAGHVKDARRLAKQQDLDPDKWFGNVENAMLLLSKREYFKKARFGYVRGTEPVNYVREIRDRYQAYLQLTAP